MPGEFDFDSAVSSVADGLGFSVDSNTDFEPTEKTAAEGEVTTGSTEGGSAPAPAPADPSAATNSPSPAPAPAAASTGAPPPQPTPAPKPGFTVDALPRTWKPELGAKWATVDPEVRAEIVRREEAMFQGLEGYKHSAKIGNDFQRVITPYLDKYARYGLDPMNDVSALLQARDVLSFGTPEQKLDVVRQIIRDFKVDVSQVAASTGEPPYTDPQVAGLQKELQEVKSTLSRADQERAAAKMAEIRSQVEAFAADPANAYFSDVADDIAQLLKAGVKDLKEAYDRAVWANPVTRAKEQQRLTAEAAAKAKADEEARVTAARKATGANVKTNAKGASATAPLGSIDDTLSETLAAIRSRS